jgi:hypothetical protein
VGSNHPATKDAQTTQTPQPAELLITMKISKDSRSDLPIKDIYDRFDDIVLRFDSTQRSQASITQKLCILIEEIQDLKRRQREGSV